MLIQFRKLTTSDQPLQFHQTVDVSNAVKGRKDIVAVQPLDVDLKATPSISGTVDVRGSLQGELEMHCSRCLKPINEHVHIPFHEVFQPVEDPEALQDENDDTTYVQGESVDLTPYVEETFLLHLPLAPVCSADCKGLCPNCGKDLNEDTCCCDTEVIDPRLAGLKDFFK
ncbi:YceD family protein [Paenibacillus glucanolyticus]|uniref:YceD family protein n=1 Tax=Paenibacillus glucanolyticus TaxID=59843 RepID=UPI003688F5D5